MPHVRLHPINRENHLALRLQNRLQPLTLAQMEGHQLIVAVQQVRHRPFADDQTQTLQSLMDFAHGLVLSVAELTLSGHHIQAKLLFGQRPAPFCSRAIGFVVTATRPVLATPYLES